MKYKSRRIQKPYLKVRKQFLQDAGKEDNCLKSRSFFSIRKKTILQLQNPVKLTFTLRWARKPHCKEKPKLRPNILKSTILSPHAVLSETSMGKFYISELNSIWCTNLDDLEITFENMPTIVAHCWNLGSFLKMSFLFKLASKRYFRNSELT